jgi:hypothetical protein
MQITFEDGRKSSLTSTLAVHDIVCRRRANRWPPERTPMWDELQFSLSLLVSGLSIGLMYSLIALGFVLVYKATGRDQLRPG